MGANENEKHYWIVTLRQEVGRKQEELLKSINMTEEELENQAAAMLIDEVGVTDQVSKYLELSDEEEKLKERLNKLDKEKSALRTDIANKIGASFYDAYYVIVGKSLRSLDGNRASEYRLKVMSSLSIGDEYLKLEKLKTNVERAVRLASTSAQLAAFVGKFLRSIGIDPLGEE
jgi:hypothetical protein